MACKPSQSWHTMLRQLRAESGLSEREAAEKAKIARSTLRKLEAGGSEVVVAKLEALLGVYGYELDAVKI